jgi:hypothetical protein
VVISHRRGAVMMSIKFDWEKIKEIYTLLKERGDLTEVVFVIIMDDKSVRKAVISLNEFMNALWKISEYQSVNAIFIQDKEGRVLYRHKEINGGNEEIPPDNGHNNVIISWKNLSLEERDSHLRLLIAQIQAYES